ncbi:UDP-N-acetylglucosamine 2-epimerase [Desulfonatronum lacustre]|uniref:UDP-N-acetylglucosamine 2-epimerase n=1 Tax=Desulfonatronum lacustre TaxID=66849 RepID=UPI00048E2DF9|nr:UDP-N-acetylglucosamine 2-epimerase [Desulfonatronum lacustre]
MSKKKVCVVVNSRANYGRIKSFLSAVQKHPDLHLQLIVGASAMLYRFGSAIDIIREDGFEPTSVVYSIVEGENPSTMAKSAGLGILELATQLENLKPDIVLTVADRFETIATAVAASYMNIPVAHTQGGELTGSIDESVRHAITKLSHIHFPATQRAGEILAQMGEDPSRIFVTGCPAMDLAAESCKQNCDDLFQKYGGTGKVLDWNQPFLVVLQHPVTTEYDKAYYQTRQTLESVKKTNMQTVWFWPNVDAGSDAVSKALRTYIAQNDKAPFHFYRNFSPEDYVRLIKRCSCIVGNSSSGIREGSFLGTPCVNIGSRQNQRERAHNVVDVGHDAEAIFQAVTAQVSHGRYVPSFLYGDGKAGERMAEVLVKNHVTIQKQFFHG